MAKLIKRLKHIFYAAIILNVLLFFYPYGTNFNDMAQQRDLALGQKQDSLLVGVSWPVDLRGAELVNGMQLAISHIGETKLIGDMRIELVVRDDQGEITTAQDIARDFSGMEQMSAVIGYADNSQATAAAVIYQTAELMQVVVGAHSSVLTRRDQLYIVRTTPSARNVAQALANTTGNNPIKFAVITEKNGYQEEFSEQFSITQIHKGSTRVFNLSYSGEMPPNFVRSSYEIRSHQADFILFAGQAEQAANFAKQAKRIGLTTPIMCSCTDFQTLQRVADSSAQDIIIPTSYLLTIDTEENKRFVSAYQKRFASVPNEWAAQGYDAMLILAYAVAQSGSIKPFDLAFSIRHMAPFPGVSGDFDFSSQGALINKPVYIRSISGSNNAKYTTIE